MLPEMQALLEKERKINKRNKVKNRPIVVMTYLSVILFMGMFAWIIYFMVHDSESVVANSANRRQDAFSDVVERGEIVTSDGTVIAKSEMDDSGNESRVYPYANEFSHVVGFNEYGRSGIELQENFVLMRSHVNVLEKFQNSMSGDKNPGDRVVTSLNFDLQETAYNALGNMQGAVVAIEPDTGRILAMVSKPDYDPNQIESVWESVHSDEGSGSTVLLNRATQGLYAPGSTFKVLTTMEYLKEHPYDYEDYSYTCEGSSIFNNVSIRCSGSKAHGTESLADSLAHSCNTSYANLGITEDMDSLHSVCERALYNKKLPFDQDTSVSKFEVTSSSDISDIPQTVIGQGNTLISPLHNALIMCAIANGGVLMKPRLIDKVESADGALIKKEHSSSYGQIFDSTEVFKIIPMLEGVSTYGTASGNLGGKPYTTAGKTGTAEVDGEGHLNSWYVGFSNVDNPDLVVCVLVENYDAYQVSGSYIASQVFDTYYNGKGDSQ